MKNLLLIGMLTWLCLPACSHKDENQDNLPQEKKKACDCSAYDPVFPPEECHGTLCKGDTCQTFLGIWKELFLERNQMSGEFFASHITICSTSLQKWNDGISFEVFYKVKIGWAESRLLDQFPVWLDPSTAGLYPSLNIPRNVLLSKEQVKILVTGNAFSAKMISVSPVNELKYSTQKEAMQVLIDSAGADTLCAPSVFYKRSSAYYTSPGHPFLEARNTLNWEENQCIRAVLDLVTGETEVQYGPCRIYK
jgi:hypothetical protein